MAKRKKSGTSDVEASLARARNKIARVEEREEKSVRVVIEKGSMTITSILMGAFEPKIPPTIAKMPTKTVVGAIAWTAAAFIPVNWLSAIFEGVGDSMFATYDYKSAMQVREKKPLPFIAGGDDVVERY